MVGNVKDVASRLYAMAAQENCDGEPYDTMQEAADYIRSIQAENAALKKEREWQPIETAPKDGRVLIIRSFEAAGEVIRKAWWDDGALWELKGFHGPSELIGWWHISEDTQIEKLELDKFPTHWIGMPSGFNTSCLGIELPDGHYTGCSGGEGCPVCEGKPQPPKEEG